MARHPRLPRRSGDQLGPRGFAGVLLCDTSKGAVLAMTRSLTHALLSETVAARARSWRPGGRSPAPASRFWKRLCRRNHVREPSGDSSMVAGIPEQTRSANLQDRELGSLQGSAQAPWLAEDPVRPRDELECRADRQAGPPADLPRYSHSDCSARRSPVNATTPSPITVPMPSAGASRPASPRTATPGTPRRRWPPAACLSHRATRSNRPADRSLPAPPSCASSRALPRSDARPGQDPPAAAPSTPHPAPASRPSAEPRSAEASSSSLGSSRPPIDHEEGQCVSPAARMARTVRARQLRASQACLQAHGSASRAPDPSDWWPADPAARR